MKSFQEIIQESNRIVALTGAGFSTESGLLDFRSQIIHDLPDGLSLEEVLSESFFISNTDEFYSFIKKYLIGDNILPNSGHYLLTELENKGKLSTVITQNIDGLHQKAGTKSVIELHGQIQSAHCIVCHIQYLTSKVIAEGKYTCKCGGFIQPNIVLYGQMVSTNRLHRAIQAVKEADMLLVAGTSLRVHPAAALVEYFSGKHLVILNDEETPYDSYATLVIRKKIGKFLSESNL